MATQSRELIDQALDTDRKVTEPSLGPSDSSDSASDRPSVMPDSDSDAANTGERASVENTEQDLNADIEADYVVDRNGIASATKPTD